VARRAGPLVRIAIDERRSVSVEHRRRRTVRFEGDREKLAFGLGVARSRPAPRRSALAFFPGYVAEHGASRAAVTSCSVPTAPQCPPAGGSTANVQKRPARLASPRGPLVGDSDRGARPVPALTEDLPGTLRLVLDAQLREVEAAYAVFDAAIAVPVNLEPEHAGAS
jgi:hypothetical protein